MLIIVPPSESKRAPAASGAPVVLEQLSFPSLLETRRRVADALIRTSADLDAFDRLYVRPTLAAEVVRNTRLFELPAMPVLDLYTGPLHDGLDASGLSEAAAERARACLVIVSALWGALRAADRIPPYRLHLNASLVGIDRLAATWREVLPEVLASAAIDAGVIVDLRSPVYQAMGVPAGASDRTVALRVHPGARGRRVGDVIAKRVRGEAARHLLETDAAPRDPHELAEVLADRWPVRLDAFDRQARKWTLTLSTDQL